MANIEEKALWEEAIYQLEVTDPVMGGKDGVDNKQAKQLGNRTAYLKKEQDALKKTTDALGADKVNLDHLIGVPLPFALKTVPDGCLAMQGQAISAEVYPKLHAMYGGTLPDLRGEFIRGWDNGRGVDAWRELLSVQGDAIRNITGAIGAYAATDSDGALYCGDYIGGMSSGEAVRYKALFDASRVVPTAHENRPRNIAFYYICLAG